MTIQTLNRGMLLRLGKPIPLLVVRRRTTNRLIRRQRDYIFGREPRRDRFYLFRTTAAAAKRSSTSDSGYWRTTAD
jgi:hypothetical protein